MKFTKILKNGIIDENPTFIQVIGMCPTLAVTTSAINGLGMGLSTTVVLICSNMLISALRKVIPDSVRIPCYIVVIAGFVTIVRMFMNAYLPDMYELVKNNEWTFDKFFELSEKVKIGMLPPDRLLKDGKTSEIVGEGTVTVTPVTA